MTRPTTQVVLVEPDGIVKKIRVFADGQIEVYWDEELLLSFRQV